MEGDHVVTVLVTTELLAEMREWSQPVQAMIVDDPGHDPRYTMQFRKSFPIAYRIRIFGTEFTIDPADVEIIHQQAGREPFRSRRVTPK
jgi:hypothetical protein